MSDVLETIMNAAERRIRIGGFGGFSFRELAAEVGVKSSSVHYYFPTKEKLAAAVIDRYTDWVAGVVDKDSQSEPNPFKVWISAFRRTVNSPEHICPATVLAAGAQDLPPEVTAAVNRFFTMCLDKLTAAGVDKEEADQFLSTITGAMVVANALQDVKAYDRATHAIEIADSPVHAAARL